MLYQRGFCVSMNYKDFLIPEKLPRHVAIIMDGNGRWAKKQQGKDRIFGHHVGVKAVRTVTEISVELGIPYLTLYTFSTENWSRPPLEVKALMELLAITVEKEVPMLIENGVKLNTIGNIRQLPERSYRKLEEAKQLTQHGNKLTLTLALNYSARWEITEAMKKVAADAALGKVKPENISQETVHTYMQTHNIPDPELLIRTSGEYRISNFLLWQIAYAELYFTDVLWPDFTKEEFCKAILNFQHRERRFGKTSEQLA